MMISGEEIGLPGVLYAAGSSVAPGRYRRVGGDERVVELAEQGNLPPSFDGRVALYARMTPAPAVSGLSRRG